MRNLIAMYVAMQTKMQSMLKDEKGATMVEYALMVALIAAISALMVTNVGNKVLAAFTSINTAM